MHFIGVLELNGKVVWVILFTLAFSVLLAPSIPLVKADSSDPIHFASGVTLLSPVNRTYNTNLIGLSYNFACGFGMSYVLSYSVDGKYGGPMPYTVKNPQELHVVYQSTGYVQLGELSEGSHTITVSLQARFSEHDIRQYVNTVYFTIDTTAPNITIQSPQNTTYTTTALPLNFTINEQANITCRLDANNSTALTQNCTLTELSIGEHNITINAQDTAGNIATQTANFTITNPTPSSPSSAAESEPSPPEPITIAAVVLAAGLIIETIVFLCIKRRKNVGDRG